MEAIEVETSAAAQQRQPGKILKACGLYVLAFVCLQLVFFALLVVAEAVPNHAIVKNLNTAVSQGIYGPISARDRMGGTADTYTECVEVAQGLGPAHMNIFQRAGEMPRIDTCSPGASQIRELASGQSLPPQDVGKYYMYWNGYTILTRPVLAWWGLGALRVISGALLVLSGVLALTALARRSHPLVALALAAPLLLSSNVLSEPSTSFSQALSMSVIALGLYLSVIWSARGLRWVVIATTLSAALFCYVDLLTIPAVPWALSGTATAMAVYLRRRDIWVAAGHGVVATACWPIAFAATWASRWLIATPFVGWNYAWHSIFHLVGFRTQGAYNGVDPSFGAPSRANFHYWTSHFATAHTVLIVAVVCWFAALIYAVMRHGWHRLLVAAILALPAVVIYVWYEALNNHSQIHTFFVYRGVPVSVGIVLAAAVFAAAAPVVGGEPARGAQSRRFNPLVLLRRRVGARTADGSPPPVGESTT